ncbi:MAG: hypothetical protein ABIN80_03430 [Dyadobacter sp.]|uniref:hypothetical protein n=1 Tax=Dyadobacter sp. TaxID=1914288 RepID=UPI003263E21A
MKQKTRVSYLQGLARLLHSAAFLFGLTFLLTSCFLKQDRTTVIYGTITDQNQQPVDSIMVLVDGTKFLAHERLNEVYSDENGNYELVVEVPKKYGSVDVVVPFGLVDNPKYDKSYKGKKSYKNDQFTKNCCHASVGQKTKYDFQLIPK